MLKKLSTPPPKVIAGTIYDDLHRHPSIRTFKVPHKNVGDTLKEEIEFWDYRTPVFIDAQTGTGKTTFIKNQLLPIVSEHDSNILLLSNRIALSSQQKSYYMETLDDPRQGLLTDKGIAATEDFGCLRIMTYHRLQSLLNDARNEDWIRNLEFVICDECHFLVADSSFNDQCYHILNLITSKFCHSKRIYMTATPWDVINPIAEAEAENYRFYRDVFAYPYNTIYHPSNSVIHYEFERDFSNVNLSFFNTSSQIADLILENRDDKSMIFVDNKEKAKEIKAQLPGVSITYLDADRKGTKEWDMLLKEEKFDAQVLITTAVLDCGVNIRDTKLKHIFIYADNRTAMMQMAGRKRCFNGDTVNIWVYDPPMNSISYRFNQCLTYLDFEEQFARCYNEDEKRAFVNTLWYSSDSFLRTLFQVKLNKIVKNKNAFYLIHRKLNFYEKILNKKFTFREAVEDWFQKEHPPLSSEIDLFYASREGCELTEEDKDTLRQIVFRAYRNHGFIEAQPTRVGNWRHTVMNTRLSKMGLPYEITVTDNNGWRFNYIPKITEPKGENNV